MGEVRISLRINNKVNEILNQKSLEIGMSKNKIVINACKKFIDDYYARKAVIDEKNQIKK